MTDAPEWAKQAIADLDALPPRLVSLYPDIRAKVVASHAPRVAPPPQPRQFDIMVTRQLHANGSVVGVFPDDSAWPEFTRVPFIDAGAWGLYGYDVKNRDSLILNALKQHGVDPFVVLDFEGDKWVHGLVAYDDDKAQPAISRCEDLLDDVPKSALWMVPELSWWDKRPGKPPVMFDHPDYDRDRHLHYLDRMAPVVEASHVLVPRFYMWKQSGAHGWLDWVQWFLGAVRDRWPDKEIIPCVAMTVRHIPDEAKSLVPGAQEEYARIDPVMWRLMLSWLRNESGCRRVLWWQGASHPNVAPVLDDYARIALEVMVPSGQVVV